MINFVIKIYSYMIYDLILAKSMPAIVAQGMLLFGFVYVIIKLSDIIKYIKDDVKESNKRKIEKHQERISQCSSKPKLRSNMVSLPQPAKNPKYRVIIEVVSCLYQLKLVMEDSNTVICNPVIFACERMSINSEPIEPRVTFVNRHGVKEIGAGEAEEDIQTWWELKIDGDRFNSEYLEFISYDKSHDYDFLTMIDMANVKYDGKIYPLKRLKSKSDADATRTSAIFENWINGSAHRNIRISRFDKRLY